jgi:Ca-activated chloride channel family protein
MAPSPRRSIALALVTSALAFTGSVGVAAQQPPETPTFKAGVDLVTISAVVRDRQGRLVPYLTVSDFQLFDNGVRRTITQFRRDESPVSLAFLLDVSGSMDVSYRRLAAREAAHHVLSWLRAGTDEAALYAFDTRLQQLQAFTSTLDDVTRAFDRDIRPFGATSLRDAIAAASERVVERGRLRRAVVVLTDGVDTASRMSAAEVANIASAIDVPVYILAVVTQIDHPGEDLSVSSPNEAALTGALADLARATGGTLNVVSVPAHASNAARQIVTELRQQYLLAFEPSGAPGWHPLELKTRFPDLIVRARRGYRAGPDTAGQLEEELSCVTSSWH